MFNTTTVTQKGQATIPKAIRDALKIKPSDSVMFTLKNGKAHLERMPSLDEVRGSFASARRTDKTDDELIKEGMRRRFKRKGWL